MKTAKSDKIDTNITSYYQSPQDIDEFSKNTGTTRHHDKLIKGLLQFTNFTGYFLSLLVNELKGITLEEFRHNTGNSEFLNLQATELGGTYTKAIRLDFIFEYNNNGTFHLRINEEAQSSQKSYSLTNEKSYSLVGRAIYYGATALVTEIKSEEEFHMLHKVYSIWICYERPIPDIREPVIRYGMKPEFDYKYIKRGNFDAASITTNRHKFDDGDLIGVILVSIPDIKLAIKTGQTEFSEKYDIDMLKNLYTLLADDVKTEERMEFYKSKHILEGDDSNMTIFEQVMKEHDELTQQNKQKDEEIEKKNKEILEMNKEISERNKEISEKDKEISEMSIEIIKLKKLLKRV